MRYQTKNSMRTAKAASFSAVCTASCAAAGTMALLASDSRLLGVVFIFAILLSIAVLVGIRLIPALRRRNPAF